MNDIHGDYDTIERTFYFLDGRKIKWLRSKEEEEYDKLDWFDTWIIYATAKGINLNEIKHSHKTRYIKMFTD